MAEALGIASGVIAVVDMATKVGGGGFKLKRLLEEFNDVPYTLLQKAEQIQEWDELFNEAERQIPPDAPPALIRNKTLLQKYAAKFRTISAELQAIVDKLLDQSTNSRRYKRKMGAAKAVLRKDDIKALDGKLDEALKQFQFSLSLYTAATLMTNPILSIETQPGDSEKENDYQQQYSGTASNDEDTSSSLTSHSDSHDGTVIYTISDLSDIFTIPHSRTIFGRLRFALGSREGLQIALRTPDWLSSSVYSVIASKSIAGWNVNFRAYEIVPNFTTVGLTDLLRDDDALGILNFLDERKMTPYVRDVNGHSLLLVSCATDIS
ncbi:hypothetical protein COL940_008506 [Colletotrichum noveboracense]|nr:hypothetical protein COL940_008506 [Colletotrichum noveboracense]